MSRPHELRVPGSVSGGVLRGGAAVVVFSGVLLVNPFPLWWWVAGLAVLLSVVAPRTMAAWIGIACMGIGLILTTPTAGRAVLAILLIHVAHLFAAWAWAVPWRSRIRVAVLLPSLRRFLVIQAIAQSVAAVMALALPPLHVPGFAWLAPLGAAVLLGMSAIALRLVSLTDQGRRGQARAGAAPDAGR